MQTVPERWRGLFGFEDETFQFDSFFLAFASFNLVYDSLFPHTLRLHPRVGPSHRQCHQQQQLQSPPLLHPFIITVIKTLSAAEPFQNASLPVIICFYLIQGIFFFLAVSAEVSCVHMQAPQPLLFSLPGCEPKHRLNFNVTPSQIAAASDRKWTQRGPASHRETHAAELEIIPGEAR